ncbi:hypothetical protein JCM19235_5018 [Vibrio maritimus]|uniref:Uncharacterized protein n=1 Tax=Vibrio maritimus TaxID=990268 RepID=A0A090S1X4_9VIBR|nr:hypothetical protein JCM19235_5018 [Vibrio maritimus]
MDFKRRYSKPLLATAYGAIVSLALPVFMGIAQASETKLERQRDTYDKAQDLIDKKTSVATTRSALKLRTTR